MDIFHLPDDIFPGRSIRHEPVIFHSYTAPAGSFKGRSILHKNAISLVLSGEKTMQFAERSVSVNPSEFHFLSSGNCLVTMNLLPRMIFKSFLIFFDSHVLSGFYHKYETRIAEIKRTHKITPEPYLAFKKDEFVVNFIASLGLLSGSSAVISEDMKRLKLEELLLHLLESDPARLLAFQPMKPRETGDADIRNVVERNIGNAVSLDELAFLCNMSLSTFKRRFEKIYSTSPNKWFLQQRMELAKDLLRHHGEKPGEVFYKVGYQNHSSFSQSFKQVVGVTPKEFQQQTEL